MSIWTREVKSIAAFSVHDILSGMYLGLLHKTRNVCNQMSFTVCVYVGVGNLAGFGRVAVSAIREEESLSDVE